MEEDEFRSTYHRVNPQRCCFEKTLLARRAGCHFAQRFSIGEREGVACCHAAAQQYCDRLLRQIRSNASFALGLPRVDGALPHAKEVKVQIGGLLGLRQLVEPTAGDDSVVADIHELLKTIAQQYPDPDQLPYATLARTIVKFEGRPRRKKG